MRQVVPMPPVANEKEANEELAPVCQTESILSGLNSNEPEQYGTFNSSQNCVQW